MPGTQSAPSGCCAFAPSPDESMRKCDAGLQSSKCHWPKPAKFPPTPASPNPPSKETLASGPNPELDPPPETPLLDPVPTTPLLDPPLAGPDLSHRCSAGRDVGGKA
jgi:hypothetical protein